MPENYQEERAPYWLPPKEVVEIIDAPKTPGVSFSPDGDWMLFIERDSMPGIEVVSRRMLQLAGLRIDPAGDCAFKSSFAKAISLRRRDSNETIKIPLAAGRSCPRPRGLMTQNESLTW